jgi:hypothetical protein
MGSDVREIIIRAGNADNSGTDILVTDIVRVLVYRLAHNDDIVAAKMGRLIIWETVH